MERSPNKVHYLVLGMLYEDVPSAERGFIGGVRIVETDHRHRGVYFCKLEKSLTLVLQQQDVGDFSEGHSQLDDLHLPDGVGDIPDVNNASVRTAASASAAAAYVFVTPDVADEVWIHLRLFRH